MSARLWLAGLTALALTLVASPAHADTTRTVTFTGDFATAFPNPDRGFHNRYEIINDPTVNDYVTSHSEAGFNPDEVDRTFARARADGDTLIHSYVHLDKYQTGDLPPALLDNLGTGLAAIRAQGLKIVLRFAYAWSEYSGVTEAQIDRHIDQLSPVLTANADVIDHLEAGFLGAWGEWHDSPYTDPFNADQAQIRYRIVAKLLAATPATIPIAIRYPIFKYEIQHLGGPLDLDRLGFHDDCFLSDSADMGTYDQNSWLGWFDVPTKKNWVYTATTSYGGNQEVGGETCDSAGADDAAGVNAQYELSHQHWSEINEDYAPVNINIWKAANLAASGNDPAETLFTRAKRKLGYRLRLLDATFGTTATPGQPFTFAAHLVNDGYAAPIQRRPAYLTFDDGSHRYDVPLPSVDVRTWLAGPVTVPTQTVTLPPGMAPGRYTLALWLPDQYASLHSNPAYDVRLANTGTWNATTGDNVLATGVTVGPCTGGCTPPPDTTAPSVPGGLASPSQTPTTVGLSWSASTDNIGVAGYRVYRGSTLAGSPAGTTFTDTGLNPSTAYTYTVQAYDAAGNTSAASAPLTVSTAATPPPPPPPPPPPAGLVLDDFDGTPPYPAAAQNDLGKWTGANCFLNGGGSGAEAGGVLTLQYSNCGWFGSDVNTDLSGYTYLVVRVKGAAGGEQAHFNVNLGGVTKVFGDFVLDGGGHPTISTTYTDIKIPMAANGINRASPGQFAMGFWYGGTSTIMIDSITFQ